MLCPDFRGRGLSDHDPDTSRYLPPTYAADILQLLALLEIGQAVFVATSLGGIVTMIIATAAPDRIAAVILNDVGPELSDEGIERIKSYVGKPILFADWADAAARLLQRGIRVGCFRPPSVPDGLSRLRLTARADSDTSVDVMDYFKEWLAELDIDAEVTAVESNRLTNLILDGEFDVFEWGWYVDPDVGPMLSYMTCDQRGDW